MSWITLLFVIGGLGVAVAGCIWLFASAFRESFWWGIGSLLVPGVVLVFLVYKWPVGKAPLMTLLIGSMILVGFYPRVRSAMQQGPDAAGGWIASLSARMAATEPTASAIEYRRAALVRREAELRQRKANLDPRDKRALERLTLQIQDYNRDLAAFQADAERFRQQSARLASAPQLPRSRAEMSLNEALR